MKQPYTTRMSRFGWLALFTSMGTLLCCALPIFLVVMGFGAVVATITYQLPWLVTLAEQKFWMFSISSGFLAICAWVIWTQRKTCPIDPELALRCQQVKRWNLRLFWCALAIWSVGFCTAYLALPLRMWLEN
jgi:mercuric ion transport protein